MARFLTMAIHFSVLVLACWTCFTCALSLEDKLTEKFEFIEAKVNHLENENSKLKETVTQLKIKIERQDSILRDLLENRQTNKGSKFSSTNVLLENPSNGKSASIPRTCREARLSNPALTSGMYWIDPDGQGVGDDPISVYCDMVSGSTSVLHDSESPTDVGHCKDPGCYSRTINYNASTRQMEALAELSNECHQSIKYDCISAPFEVNGVAYSWWNDRTGNPNYFWSGSNSSIHLCQCGIDQNCIEAFMPCNCDSGLSIPLSDVGVITDKSVLPIARLNFGRTILQSSSGIYTLGRFECTGQVVINRMPSSCEDLWRIGHTLNGLYSVMGTKMVESIYCDFTKLPYDIGFQKLIGYTDVKSTPTYFYLQKNSNFSTLNTPIPFEIEKLNIGGTVNKLTGKFTVPRTGKYFFSFNGAASFPGSSFESYLWVSLYLNGNVVMDGGVDEGHTVDSPDGQQTPLNIQSTLHLQAEDQIWLQIKHLSSGGHLSGHSHFNGWLFEEEIAQTSYIL